MGAHTGLGTHSLAGLMAAYSPQMESHSAIHNAVRSATEGEPVRQGQGPYVTSSHAKSANKILAGEHHQEALGGAKSQDLAHLVEHGGRDPENGGWSHRAPMGHNEFAVASGLGYADEQSEKDSRKVLGNRHYYDHLSGMFHEAAQRLNDRDGTSLAGHHIQATTNLAAKRMADEDSGMTGPGARVERDRGQTRNYVTKNVPGVDPTNTHLAYGETKAPSEVDTLRDEACPVCGETDAWDGDECKVCDYVAPPQKFQDPDVDMHKKLDLRSDQQADMTAGDLNSAVNDQDGDGLDDRTGEPIEDAQAGADDQQPALVCEVCGFEAPAPEPMSISTEDPEAGSTGGQPVEGDLCPNCGKGVLESSENLGMGMEGGGPDEGFAPEEEQEEPGSGPPEDEEPGENAPPEADDEHPDDVDSGPPEEEDDDEDDEDEDEDGRPVKKPPFPPKR